MEVLVQRRAQTQKTLYVYQQNAVCLCVCLRFINNIKKISLLNLIPYTERDNCVKKIVQFNKSRYNI